MVDINALRTNAGDAVNGRWVDIPGFPGLRCRIASFRLSDWIGWMEKTRDEYDDDEDRERAFYGSRIIRDVEGLEEDGKPIEWNEQVGARYLTDCDEVVDESSEETVKVYTLDAIYFWCKQFAQDPRNYALKIAGN